MSKSFMGCIGIDMEKLGKKEMAKVGKCKRVQKIRKNGAKNSGNLSIHE